MFGYLPTRVRDQPTAMASVTHDNVEPVTDHVHENSWSANLEQPEHADDRDLLLAQAVDAVEKTAAGHHVNLVTHGDHGNPDEYLFAVLHDEFGEDIDYEYVEQCGCGGHVTRVDVQK